MPGPEAQLIANKWAKHGSLVGWSIDSEEVQEVLVNGEFFLFIPLEVGLCKRQTF